METKAKIIRFPTLRIVDLMSTRVQSVRLDLVGPQSRLLVRLGTWLIFLPFVLLGYLLVVAAVVRLVAVSIGWGVTLVVFGAAHLIVGILGMFFARDVGLAQSQPVLKPELESTIARHRAADGAGAGPSGRRANPSPRPPAPAPTSSANDPSARSLAGVKGSPSLNPNT